jgi:hypothetical protein
MKTIMFALSFSHFYCNFAKKWQYFGHSLVILTAFNKVLYQHEEIRYRSHAALPLPCRDAGTVEHD